MIFQWAIRNYHLCSSSTDSHHSVVAWHKAQYDSDHHYESPVLVSIESNIESKVLDSQHCTGVLSHISPWSLSRGDCKGDYQIIKYLGR